MTRYPLLHSLLLASFCHVPVTAEDWPQFAGKTRDGVWTESGILSTFPEEGLKPVWSVPIGSGYSGPVVAEGRIVVTDYRPKPDTTTLEAIERVLCLDETTGNELWSHTWPTHYRRQMQSYATGPRATPLIEDGFVYSIGATGHICCLSLKTGDVRWEIDALKEFGAKVPVFGVSAGPVAWKNTVIFPCGGADGLLLALDKKSGRELWKALPADYDLPYAAPEILTLNGRPQLVQWSKEQLTGLNPDNGEILWSVPFSAQSNMAIARPVQIGNRILVSGFYDGSMLVDVKNDGARSPLEKWRHGRTSQSNEEPARGNHHTHRGR